MINELVMFFGQLSSSLGIVNKKGQRKQTYEQFFLIQSHKLRWLMMVELVGEKE